MKIVKVTYTTRTDYVSQNQQNIQAVMNDLRQSGNRRIFYFSSLGSDGKSFMHIAFFEAEDDEKELLMLPSFKKFQQELKASVPETPPRQELLSLVGSSREIFAS